MSIMKHKSVNYSILYNHQVQVITIFQFIAAIITFSSFHIKVEGGGGGGGGGRVGICVVC